MAGPAPAGSTYLNVPFAEKEDAKAKGAKWDKAAHKWYVPPALKDQLHRFHTWQPGVREAQDKARQEYLAQHADRVYLGAHTNQGERARSLGAVWDPDFPGPPRGAWFVPPELTGDLARFHDVHNPCGWVPVDVQAGGAAAAAADADVAHVEVPEQGLPAHTFKWVYFRAPDGVLMRRARRWKKQGGAEMELLTQGEYNRRVDDAAWPAYKPDDEYEVDPRPEWHGGGGYVMPDITLDRRSAISQDYAWYVDPSVVEKKKGQYRDKDEVVRAAPGGTTGGAGGGSGGGNKRAAGSGAGGRAKKSRKAK